MRPTTRISAILYFCGSAAIPLSAQEIANWAAPPLWSPAAVEDSEGSMGKQGLATSPLPFIGITPCRIVDTRGVVGPYGAPPLPASIPRTFDLNDGPCGPIPGSVGAYSLNVTVTNTAGPGLILINPTGGPVAVVSTLNYTAGQTIANAAVVPAGTGGAVDFTAGVSGTDLIIDINGYYSGTVQARVTGTCAAGSSIRGIDVNGGVICETDDDTTYSAGTGLTLASGMFSFDVGFGDSRYWKLDGNAVTLGSFVGTTNNEALDFRVNGARALRLEPHGTSPNVIGGYGGNTVTAGAQGATVSGGGSLGSTNRVTDDYGTVGGGRNNQAGNGDVVVGDRFYATVGGGLGNEASGSASTVGGGSTNTATFTYATVGGGQQNDATDFASTVAGGFGNMASAADATVGGGLNNVASGIASAVPGGVLNEAVGLRSFAAGTRAKANHQGAFVWADSQVVDLASTGNNEFIVRAGGGIWLGTTSSPSIPVTDFLNTSTGAHLTTGGTWTNNSDRAAKDEIRPVDGRELLSRLAQVPISSWSYKAEPSGVRHVGPMAQDFRAAFGLGSDERSISTVDADGVALAAIQELYRLLLEKEGQIRALTVRLEALEELSP